MQEQPSIFKRITQGVSSILSNLGIASIFPTIAIDKLSNTKLACIDAIIGAEAGLIAGGETIGMILDGGEIWHTAKTDGFKNRKFAGQTLGLTARASAAFGSGALCSAISFGLMVSPLLPPACFLIAYACNGAKIAVDKNAAVSTQEKGKLILNAGLEAAGPAALILGESLGNPVIAGAGCMMASVTAAQRLYDNASGFFVKKPNTREGYQILPSPQFNLNG